MGIWILPLGFLIVFGAITIFAWFSEKREWNEGICPKCGNPWEYFDTDSQGGRGYTCRVCKSTTWISWPFIDTVKVKND